VLHGSKPWCSLAALLDHAVLTAHLEGGGRAAFAVNLHAQGVSAADPGWTSRGLREIPSGTVQFEAVPAVPLGGPGWYYERPGFAWGGMGVAACWLGGAVAVGRSFTASLRKAADGGREPDQIALAQLGEIDRTLAALTAYLAATAARIDSGELSGRGAWQEALRVRGGVAAAVERIQTLVNQNLGPGPLAFDEAYGKRMADLALYIGQHHAMRDDAQLGALTLTGDDPW
jgi:alkylation response protein AidB-like acyl-CoA dehydrogenase